MSSISAVPNGYNDSLALILPRSTNGISSYNQIIGDSAISATLIAGAPIVAAVTGNGDITTAVISYITEGEIAATLTGSGDIVGTLSYITHSDLVAALTGDSSIVATLTEGRVLEAVLTGDNTITATLIGTYPISSSIVGNGDIVSDLLGIGYMIVTIPGSSSTSVGATDVPAYIGATITAAGETLTTTNVASAVWSAVVEAGFTYEQAIEILLAVAAGKTTIVDLGGGDATVTFRDLDDVVDRVVADMSGSERTNVTIS
jgi:hypothetical protein